MDQEIDSQAKVMWTPDRKKRTNMDAFRDEVNRNHKTLKLGGKFTSAFSIHVSFAVVPMGSQYLLHG